MRTYNHDIRVNMALLQICNICNFPYIVNISNYTAKVKLFHKNIQNQKENSKTKYLKTGYNSCVKTKFNTISFKPSSSTNPVSKNLSSKMKI